MDRVPREQFMPENVRPDAYEDTPLYIGHNQTISAPSMVAAMCQLLDIPEGCKVLEIGTGMGYHAAVMAELVGSTGTVFTVERIPELADQARSVLSMLGYDNVKVFLRDGTEGLPDFAPYDRISVAAAAPEIPKPLVDQLNDPGRLVIPVGRYFQQLMLVEKKGGHVLTTDKGGVAFVPLLGKYGFKGY